ncbi:cob(I)yrinic acid a,c-diamide adenosyltransferase [Roseococcus sp. SYP-B2431]|uniref:cob(I)yrinic acid a,c-diamide adenosyltransferase n=1 Tax=Roseococcus sp. SYP-B2431 TaxID=2496640 RepID=UPI00103D869B|nr:cob(I)yrinic acid a,c-diamide adenosyltransferase [Roseococcus sp. SYP-B2431]TCH96630.1 cob(I)yrinic acid a,c-diamide adenosyltransferase [Roseococcus sp. SYP-B2431]
MVKLDVITTRGGDGGETSLGDGTRLRKDALRIQAIGEVDELNSVLGLLRLQADAEADAMLARMQNDLFDLGADLCMPGTEGGLRMSAAQCLRLEREVAAMNAAIPPLRSFVLPGGTPAAAHAHLARTVARRAERSVVALAAAEPVNPEAVRWLNRASDHLFVLSRRFNGNGAGDVLWVPGGNR